MGCTPRNSPSTRRCCRQARHTSHPWRPSTWSSMRGPQHIRSSEHKDSGVTLTHGESPHMKHLKVLC